jgi:hypothetical protein
MYCINCGSRIAKESKFCRDCGAAVRREPDAQEHHQNPHHNSQTSAQAERPEVHTKTDAKPGLGGWLAFLGLALVLAPFVSGYNAYDYLPLLSESWNISGFTTILHFEFLASIAAFVFSFYFIYLFFRKDASFPTAYTIYTYSYGRLYSR